VLILPHDQILPNRPERLACFAEGLERGEGCRGEALGFFAGFLQAEQRRVGGFLRGHVFTCAFAELFAGLRDVQDVVDDLEGEAEVFAECSQGFHLGRRGVSAHRTEPDGGGEERGGFGFVNKLQVAQGKLLTFAFEVGDLPGNERPASGGLGKFLQKCGDGVTRGAFGCGEDFKRDGEQRVPGEDGDAFTEDLVAGGAAPAKVVVVHAREVVMDERIGVDALHGTRGRQGGFDGTAARFRCREAEDGPQPFAARKERVAHGFVDGSRFDGRFGEELVERAVHDGAACNKIILQDHADDLSGIQKIRKRNQEARITYPVMRFEKKYQRFENFGGFLRKKWPDCSRVAASRSFHIFTLSAQTLRMTQWSQCMG